MRVPYLERHHFAVALYRVGCCPGDGLLLATGHFRNGVLLSAITGEIISALVLGESSPTRYLPILVSQALAPDHDIIARVAAQGRDAANLHLVPAASPAGCLVLKKSPLRIGRNYGASVR